MNFIKGHAKFIFGINTVEQLDSWLEENPSIKGMAMVGRSNVGKSSLINAMFGKSTARTSKTPGRTQQVNIFEYQVRNGDDTIGPFYLFDLPGYGHAKVSKEMSKLWDQLMSSFFQKVSSNILMINIQDARRPSQNVDKDFFRFLSKYPFEVFLILNKLDKLKKQSEKAQLKNEMEKIYKEYKNVKLIFQVSAEKNLNIEQLEQSLLQYHLL